MIQKDEAEKRETINTVTLFCKQCEFADRMGKIEICNNNFNATRR